MLFKWDIFYTKFISNSEHNIFFKYYIFFIFNWKFTYYTVIIMKIPCFFKCVPYRIAYFS